MEPLISVIVPIYKVEPYLKKCVDSILTQTHKNLEIILVDDGSPDNCGAICDEYAAKDSRIRVIHKPNGGLSDARNAGMKIMTGQYVAFVDSDDWIEPNMYSSLLGLITRFEADMAFGGVADDLETDGNVTTVRTSDYSATLFAEDKISAMRRYFHGSWAAWDKLYKAELFEGIVYPVGEINEDEAIVLHLLNRCERVCYTNEIFYHYMRRIGSNSITSTSFSPKKLAWVKHCRDNLAFIRSHHPLLELDAAKRYRGSLTWSMTEMLLSEQDFSAEIRDLRCQLKREKKIFSQISFPSKQEKLRFSLLTSGPLWLYRTLIRIKRG